MVTIATDVDLLTVEAATTVNRVGICFFDPITESLLEIDSEVNHFLTVEPYKSSIRKYYLVVTPGDQLISAAVSFTNTSELVGKYSIKAIISSDQPSLMAFENLTSFNETSVEAPVSGVFIPLWIYIESSIPTNLVSDLGIEINYE